MSHMPPAQTAASERTQTPPPPKPRSWSKARIIGTGLLGFWALCGLGVIWVLISGYDGDFYQKYAPKFLTGTITTLQLVATSIAIGFLLSLPLAYTRMSRNRALSALGFSYVYFFRGTPLLAQTFLIYYGVGSFVGFFRDVGLWWFFRDAWNCAVLAFVLNTAAYQAEILRGAIQTIGKGQWEAAKSLGLPFHITFGKIILPQSMIVALRPYGNEIILMIKGSAIVSIITIYDLMGETERAYSRSFDFQTYIWAAIIYLAIVEILRRVWNGLETRLTRHLQRAG